MTAAIVSGRRRVAPHGLAGGAAATPGANLLERNDRLTELPGVCRIELAAGDALIIKTPGGGGLVSGPRARHLPIHARQIDTNTCSFHTAEHPFARSSKDDRGSEPAHPHHRHQAIGRTRSGSLPVEQAALAGRRVLQRWAIDTGWWSDELHVDRRYLRVVAQGRVFDLFFDRVRRRWFLERAL